MNFEISATDDLFYPEKNGTYSREDERKMTELIEFGFTQSEYASPGTSFKGRLFKPFIKEIKTLEELIEMINKKHHFTVSNINGVPRIELINGWQ